MKNIITSGRRKQSVARAVLKEGKGRIIVNKLLLAHVNPEMIKLKMMEPLTLAGDVANKVNIEVTINGGGIITQADAARLAIARALVQYSPKLKEVFLNYDRQLLVADIRVKEVSKPNHHGQARAKTQTSYR
jgi:small subunit ribosomal protein S9